MKRSLAKISLISLLTISLISCKERAIEPENSASPVQSVQKNADGSQTIELQYGTDPLQVANLYFIDKNAPLVVVVHGGGPDEPGDKSAMTGRRKMYNDMGYNVLTPNYRYGRNTMDDRPLPVYDIWCSISTTLTEGKTYEFAPQKIFVHGYSYGGMTTSQMVFDQDFDWSKDCANQATFTVSKFIGESSKYEDAAQNLDPQDPPTLLIHGSLDPKIDPKNSEIFKTALEEAGLSAQLKNIDGGTHHLNIQNKQSVRILIETFLNS